MKMILTLLAVAVIAGACEGRSTVVETKEVNKCFCNDQEIVCGNTCAPETVTVTECRCNGAVADCNTVCEPETVTVTECRCNGDLVNCDAVCEPETVTNTVCRCNGETSACDATCEPLTVTETVYVCEIDGREVSDPADCPTQVLVCEDDQISFTNTETGEIGCVDRGPPGTLSITIDGSTAKSTIILGNSTGVPTSVFRFTAAGEGFTVTDIPLENCLLELPDTNGNCSDPGEVPGDDAVATAVKITYQTIEGATVTESSGYLVDGRVHFLGTSFFIPADSMRTLSVTLDTNSVSSITAISGSRIQLNLDAVSGISTFRAVGAASGAILTASQINQSPLGKPMTLRKTKPTVSLAAGSPSGAGTPGLHETLRINVSADPRGFVGMKAILFKVTVSDSAGIWSSYGNLNQASKWEFFALDDPSSKLDDDGDWIFLNADGTVCSPGNQVRFALLVLNADMTTPAEEIGAGVTKTYALRTDTTGASANDDDAIRIDIPDQTEASALGMSSIIWDDDTEAQDIDGRLVKNLSVTGGTIVF